MKFISGWGSGLLGVIIFSGSLPATKIAISDFNPLFLTSARATIAALIGLSLLMLFRQRLPVRSDLVSLIIVAFGVVVGFPLFTAMALQYITSAHSIVFIGLLPLMTAIFGIVRAGERPKASFWIFSLFGAALVTGYSLIKVSDNSLAGDMFMIAAIITCGLGYAEGAILSKRLGGWQVISWSLLISLPIMIIISIWNAPDNFMDISTNAWLGLTYVSLFSMIIGFVFWYRGLAIGGISKVGQLQLLQPFFGFILAHLLLGEEVELTMLVITILVIFCIIGVKRFS